MVVRYKEKWCLLKFMVKPLKIIFLGLRSFPGVQGGIEKHVENLAPRLAALGCDVHVIVRKPYHHAWVGKTWRKVHFHTLWSPKSKIFETFVHTFWGVVFSTFLRANFLHLQAIGPAIMTPLARICGAKVIVTHHGPDYDRQKWGFFAKFILKVGERWGMQYSDGQIAISEVIRELIWQKYQIKCTLIPNGVSLPALSQTCGALTQFGLTPGKYILIVSRLVPEKRHLDLIEAFKIAHLNDWKLVIVGASDHPDAYTQKVLDSSCLNSKVICTGFKSGTQLSELYTHAGLFVLPSSHEGLPIAILEALSYGLPVLASDIPANMEVGLANEHYFPLGDISVLAQSMVRFSGIPITHEMREKRRQWVAKRYDWQQIAEKTHDLYRELA